MQPTEQETEQGYVPPTVTQFSVFLDNRVGKLLEVLESIDASNIAEVRGLSIIDSSDYAVVRFIFNNSDAARVVLDGHDCAYCQTPVLVVELVEAQTLASVCRHLLRAEINIRFSYSLIPARTGASVFVICTDDPTFAGQVMRRKGCRVLGEADLA
ncbi:MAG: hypothetical protein EXS10_03535 [Phycisphaerales bacterium]|nr:hypothetical protein [Phycisphaerales bacterium]